MTMLSHARNAEDVVLARVFADQAAGFFVDVGAGDPAGESATRHLVERGWRGVDVTDDPGVQASLAAARPQGVVVLARLGPGGPGAVEALDLGAVVAAHAPPEGAAFLRIGGDADPAAIIGATDWKAMRPRVMLVHAVDATGAPSHFGWHRKLVQGAYRLALFDGINRFYVREEDAEVLLPRLSAPANVLDDWRPAREQERLAALEAAVAVAAQELAVARDAQAGLLAARDAAVTEAAGLRDLLVGLQAARDAAVTEAAGLRQVLAAAQRSAQDAAAAAAARIAELEAQPAGGGLAGRLVTALRGRPPARDR